MLTKIFTDTLMIFLITYALIEILHRFFKFLNRCNEPAQIHRKLLIYCDSDEHIENLVRSSSETAREAQCELILAIKKETHENKIITNQLQNEFPYLKIIKFSGSTLHDIFGEDSPQDT